MRAALSDQISNKAYKDPHETTLEMGTEYFRRKRGIKDWKIENIALYLMFTRWHIFLYNGNIFYRINHSDNSIELIIKIKRTYFLDNQYPV